jgi:hypothetical protein
MLMQMFALGSIPNMESRLRGNDCESVLIPAFAAMTACRSRFPLSSE